MILGMRAVQSVRWKLGRHLQLQRHAIHKFGDKFRGRGVYGQLWDVVDQELRHGDFPGDCNVGVDGEAGGRHARVGGLGFGVWGLGFGDWGLK